MIDPRILRGALVVVAWMLSGLPIAWMLSELIARVAI